MQHSIGLIVNNRVASVQLPSVVGQAFGRSAENGLAYGLRRALNAIPIATLRSNSYSAHSRTLYQWATHVDFCRDRAIVRLSKADRVPRRGRRGACAVGLPTLGLTRAQTTGNTIRRDGSRTAVVASRLRPSPHFVRTGRAATSTMTRSSVGQFHTCRSLRSAPLRVSLAAARGTPSSTSITRRAFTLDGFSLSFKEKPRCTAVFGMPSPRPRPYSPPPRPPPSRHPAPPPATPVTARPSPAAPRPGPPRTPKSPTPTETPCGTSRSPSRCATSPVPNTSPRNWPHPAPPDTGSSCPHRSSSTDSPRLRTPSSRCRSGWAPRACT